MPSEIQNILDRALAGTRLTADDCTALLESHDVAGIGAAADEIRQQKHPDNIVTYIIGGMRTCCERCMRSTRLSSYIVFRLPRFTTST